MESGTITIITTNGIVRVPASRWARDDSGDVPVYDDSDDDAETITTVDSDAFVAAVRGAPTVREPSARDQIP